VGRPELAKPFLDGGAQAYIGPVDGPEGSTGFIFTTLFFHSIFFGKHTVEEACKRASQWDSETGMYQLFTATEQVK